MIVVIIYIIISLFLGLWGSNKVIGFWGAFLLSLVLTPAISFWIILFSKDQIEFNNQRNFMLMQQRQFNAIKQMQNQNTKNNNIVSELEKLEELKAKGMVSEEEYQKIRTKIIV